MSYHYTETAHTLTKDVVNPFAAVVDKRLRSGWLNEPVIKAGTRFILSKIDLTRDFAAEGVKPGSLFRTEISPDASGCDSNHSTHGIDTTRAATPCASSSFWASTAYCSSEPVPIRTTSGLAFDDSERM